MASQQDQARTNFVVGLFVVGFGAVLVVSMFVIATSNGLLKSKSELTADFRTIAGLNDSSAVQLSGRAIGKVIGFEFTQRQYACKAETEDFGRKAQGRTDDCEPSLFCINDGGEGLCAELEAFAGFGVEYAQCKSDADCPSKMVCVDKAFRKRYHRLIWAGPEGVCAPFKVHHSRVTVTMRIDEDKKEYVRQDSRATIQSNGVLGDKLVDITVGYGEALGPDNRVQSSPSMVEEIEMFKDQLYSITGKVEGSLAGVEGLFDELNNENTKEDLRGILANLNVISRDVTQGKGLVSALLHEESMKEDVKDTLGSVRRSVANIDKAVASVSKEVPGTLSSIRSTAKRASTLLQEIQDPQNKALVPRLFHDDSLGNDVTRSVKRANQALAKANESLDEVDLVVTDVSRSLRRGKGTLGKLLKDPKAYDDLVKLLGNMERNNVVKKLVRYVIAKDEAASAARPRRSGK